MSKRMPPGAAVIDPIVRRKLSDEVFERLRDMIASGVLSPGDHMPSERTLMERFGVGRPAVREALQSLETKGLITIAHGERSRVNELSARVAFQQVDDVARLLLSSEPSNLDDLKEMRQIIETGIVRIAAEKCTEADTRALKEKLAFQRRQIGDAESFTRADMDFHNRIAQITGNPLVVAVSESMLTWLFQYHTSLLRWSGHEEKTLAEHKQIIELLEQHDPAASAQMMVMHLNRSEALYQPHN